MAPELVELWLTGVFILSLISATLMLLQVLITVPWLIVTILAGLIVPTIVGLLIVNL